MKQIEQKTVDAIRVLSAEAVQKANSGHPGLPMGAAPLAYTIFAKAMKHNPQDSSFADRDRFVLSAGHGSMLLYSLLYLCGYDITIEDIKQFRQWGSKTPGHPEYGITDGVETSTGPLGQGVANAVGMAIAETHLAARFNKEGFPVADHHTYVLVGDGCLQEGIAYEAVSLAGTLKLGKLIMIYDKNNITIEGDISSAFDENVAARFEACGWQAITVEDGNDLDAVAAAIETAKAETEKPSIVICRTQIGFGCPAKQGKSSAHGEPLGEENLAAAKALLKWEYEPFDVPQDVREYMLSCCEKGTAAQVEWESMMQRYACAYPQEYQEYQRWMSGISTEALENDEAFWEFSNKADATRSSSGIVLNRLAEKMPELFGGSADLAPSNKSLMNGREYYSPQNRAGSNVHFGIREHAMAAICNGLYLHGGVRPYCATFFVFCDYMKNAMRMSALMKLPVIYILTHDSIGVGEDGPTHEPIEHLAALRSIPNLTVFRPADGKETAAAYCSAVSADGPTAIVLSRQNLPQQSGSGKQALKGGYVISPAKREIPEAILMATGSEVSIAATAQQQLATEGIDVSVVSIPSFEVFDKQSEEYKQTVLPNAVRARVAIEAASSFGWAKYVGLDGAYVTLDHFGASAPAPVLFEKFGITAENIVHTVKALLKHC